MIPTGFGDGLHGLQRGHPEGSREERRGLRRVPTRGVEAVLGVRERKWERGTGAVPCFQRKVGGRLGEKVPIGGPWVPEREGELREGFLGCCWAGLASGRPSAGFLFFFSVLLLFSIFCFLFSNLCVV
jgi:hypothetical protein